MISHRAVFVRSAVRVYLRGKCTIVTTATDKGFAQLRPIVHENLISQDFN